MKNKLFLSYLGIVIILFAFYLLIVIDNKGLGPDPAAFLATARNIYAGKGITNDFISFYYQDYDSVTHPEDLRVIFFPIILALVYMVFGISSVAGIIAVAKAVNVVFFLAFAVILYMVVSKLFDEKTAFFSSLAIILCPCFFFSYYFLYPMTEPLFYILLLLDSYFFVKLITPASSERFTSFTPIIFGLLLGFTVLQRYSGLLLILVVLGLGLIYLLVLRTVPKGNGDKSVALRSAARKQAIRVVFGLMLALLVCFVIILPDLLRNYFVFGTVISPPFAATTDILYKCEGLGDVLEQHIISYSVGQDFPCTFKNVALSTLLQTRLFFSNAITLFLFILALVALFMRKTFKLKQRIFLDFSLLSFFIFSVFHIFRSHYELRYFTPFLILFIPVFVSMLLSCFKNSSCLKSFFHKYFLVLLLIILILCSVYIPFIVNYRQGVLPTYDSVSSQIDWVLANTAPDDVIMAFIPARLNLYTARKTLNIPDDDITLIKKIADKYKVRYILFDASKVVNTSQRQYKFLNLYADTPFNSRCFFRVGGFDKTVVYENQCLK